MRALKSSVGHLVLLMPEEQKHADVIETIGKLKKTGRVVIFISGNESIPEVICKLMKISTLNK